MNVTPRQLLICITVSVGTMLFLARQQRLVEQTTVYTRAASVLNLKEKTLSAKVLPPNSFVLENSHSRPPLSDLIGDNNTDIKTNVQFLLDFAIVGHPKTATTFKLGWLNSHKEVLMHPREIHSLQQGNPAELVSMLYALPEGHQYKRGYKAPTDIGNPEVLRLFKEHWPDTKLIVGLRNPVNWFESFYNFRVRKGYEMPPPETLVGNCGAGTHGVCTDEANFHIHLSYLGKTNKSSAEEQQLLEAPFEIAKNLPSLPNKVFLYEISQLRDSNSTRAALYRSDLEDYLGLKEPLEPIPDDPPSRNKTHVLDICEENYSDLRSVLTKHGQAASTWIRTYFLPHPDVRVSSPEYFKELLKEWMTDPCLEAKQ